MLIAITSKKGYLTQRLHSEDFMQLKLLGSGLTDQGMGLCCTCSSLRTLRDTPVHYAWVEGHYMISLSSSLLHYMSYCTGTMDPMVPTTHPLQWNSQLISRVSETLVMFLRLMTMLIKEGWGPESRRSCIASYSSCPFVRTWRRLLPLQICAISQGKSLKILCHGRELDRGHGEGWKWDTFILPLSYHDPDHRGDRQWDTIMGYHAIPVATVLSRYPVVGHCPITRLTVYHSLSQSPQNDWLCFC